MVTAGSFIAGGLFIFAKEMINIAIKLATSITYTADGSQTNFSIPFDYLRPSFVHVAVNDEEVSEGFTVSNRGIMFDSAPAKDVIVRIYRNTPTSRLVSWADASILKAIDMTIAEIQQLHILEEASDWSKTHSIALDDEGKAWQGRNCRMSNIADPVDAQDVVTKHYLDNEEGSFTAAMNTLKTQTEQAASAASSSKESATKSAQSAELSATNAAKSAELAETAKSDISLYAENAKTSETNANASKEAAQSAANSASSFAAAARSSASEAKSYRDAASTYATNAKNYSENVNVFVPSVSSDGVLSWSNKAGLTNPPSVNIKGKDGADGGVTVDAELSDTSTNAIQNKVVKAALDKRAVLDDTNTFTSPNTFDIIYMQKNVGSIRWYEGSQSVVTGHINATSYTGEANTAKKASKDGDGNVITSTYATKTELNSCVKTVNNITPDTNGNVTITASGGGSNITVDDTLSITSTNPIQNKAVALKFGEFTEAFNTKANIVDLADVATSGQYYDLKNTPTVDTTLSSTSTNAIQNKAVYNALLNKVGTDIYSGFVLMGATSTIAWRQGTQPVGSINASNYTGNAASATKATQDGAGNVIADTYAKKTDVSNTYATKSDVAMDLNEKLGKLDTAVAATAATKALQDGDGNTISLTYVKTVNNTKPDSNGNVNITVSGGGSDSGVSLSAQNKWTAQQTFDTALLEREKYTTMYDSGTSITPIQATASYTATGNFTLDLTTATYLLSIGQSQVLTVYIKSSADYALTLKGAGTIKYIGAASDLAITSAGLLLNILMMSDGSGVITSIVQASKLS